MASLDEKPARLHRVLPILLATLVVGLAYAPSLGAGFVWLDHFEIESGFVIVDSWSELRDVLHDDKNGPGYQRPIYNLLHSLDAALWGLAPRGFHLSSILYHLMAVALVAVLLGRTALGRWGGLAAATLWGLHPVNTACVGLIHAKADLFFVLALLAALALALVYRDSSSRARGGLAGACSLALLALALGTKEPAFLFVPALILGYFAGGARLEGDSRQRSCRYILAASVVTGLAVLSRIVNLDLPWPEEAGSVGPVERIATFAGVYLEYLWKLCLPIDLSIADTVTRFGALSSGTQFLSVTGASVALLCQVLAARRWRWSARWILLLNLFLLPVVGVVPLLHFRADRFLYLPSLFFVALWVDAARRLVAARSHRTLLAAGALCGALFIGRIQARLVAFHDDLALFAPEIERTPDYKEGLLHMAVSLDRLGRHEEATVYYERCAEAHPHRISFRPLAALVLNYANNLLELERYEDAHELLLRHAPAVEDERYGERLELARAVAAYFLGRDAEARPVFEAYRRAHPEEAPAHFFAGFCAHFSGEPEAARAAFARYLELGSHPDRRREVEQALAELEHR